VQVDPEPGPTAATEPLAHGIRVVASANRMFPASAARARSADSRLSTRSRASAGPASGQRAARTLSELSKFT